MIYMKLEFIYLINQNFKIQRIKYKNFKQLNIILFLYDKIRKKYNF